MLNQHTLHFHLFKKAFKMLIFANCSTHAILYENDISARIQVLTNVKSEEIEIF